MNLSFLKKAVCAFAASALALSLPAQLPAAAAAPDAWAITADMGAGWNLGNTLECTYWADDPTPAQTATAWGNPEPTQALISAVKAQGFSTVRIPVTWYQHMTKTSSGWVIDSDWLDYVQKTVDYAYGLGMYVIINVHHEDWINVSSFTSSTLSEAKIRLEDIWQQVSDRFAGYGSRLIFEGMNEPRQTYSSSVEWGNGDSWSWDYINQLNAVFVNTVRADDSANNRSRLLMIPSYHATDNYEALSNLAIPSNAGNLAISVHAYEPYSFTMDTSESHIYESNNQYGGYIPTLLSNVMNDLKKIQSEKGVPIIIGEFGASDFNNSSERIKWARDYMSQASAAGFPCILWDNNVTTSWGDSFGVFNRNSCTLNSGAYDYVNAIISGARSSSGGASDSGSTGSDDTSLSAWSALTLFTDNTYADGKHDIVISCTAETAPQLVLERIGDYSWNARVEASSVSDGKAYYTADSIAAALSANGMNQSSVSKICMLTVCSTAYYGVTAQEVVTEQPSDDTDYSWHMIFGSDGAACLNAWNSTTVSWDTSLLDGSYDFAVIYSGSSAPVFVAENAYDYSWNVNVNADSRSSTGIAYYSADDIAAKFSQYGVSRWDMGRLILMASDYTEIYGVYVFAA